MLFEELFLYALVWLISGKGCTTLPDRKRYRFLTDLASGVSTAHVHSYLTARDPIADKYTASTIVFYTCDGVGSKKRLFDRSIFLTAAE